MTLRAPFPWFGGKALAAPLIWRAFGNVPNYVEPFFGSGAALLARPHAPKVETVNDKDGFIANAWRAIQHAPDEVAKWCDWPVNEADLHARHRWLVAKGAPLLERLIDDPDFYDARIAGWWIWGLCTWIGNGWCHKDERLQKRTESAPDEHTPHKKMPRNARGAAGIHKVAAGPISVPQYGSLPKVGTPGHGIHAPGRKKPLTHRGKGVNKDSKRGGLEEVFAQLAERLRYVRVCCGDWTRVVGRSTLGIDTSHGMTPCGVLLDPPYKHELRDKRLYREDAAGISDDVRQWAIEHGDNPALRIALCGQIGEHEMPDTWTEVAWASTSSAQSRTKERIWFSPNCLAATIQTEMFAS